MKKDLCFTNMTRKAIEEFITNDPDFINYTIIITGKAGPTGKTTLANNLKEKGYKAIEISEHIHRHVEYTHPRDYNTLIIDISDQYILVILNKGVSRIVHY